MPLKRLNDFRSHVHMTANDSDIMDIMDDLDTLDHQLVLAQMEIKNLKMEIELLKEMMLMMIRASRNNVSP